MHQVNKRELFRPDYRYRAGLTKDVLAGMQGLVKRALELPVGSSIPIILDVGCNDGSLLEIFKSKSNCVTVGVDPTDAIHDAMQKVDHTYQEYFTRETANKIVSEVGKPDFITFTNVFAHIEDFQGLLEALSLLISADNYLIIENHYLGAIIDRNQFDTFYHEHPRTYSATSFRFIAAALGMQIHSIEFPSRYGGNIRVIMSKKNLDSELDLESIFEAELGFINSFAQMQNNFDAWLVESKMTVSDMLITGSFAGKSLPGRAVMLISALGITAEQMPYIFEQPKSPKVGHYVPGTQIEVKSDSDLLSKRPTRVVVWSWHIVEEVADYLMHMGFHGEIWVPLPKFELYKRL